ncbi:choice-of-anchor Q domain-containing protein [Arthrobacter sp. I3]|uniref:choice-of-anchor Q domain-containing protein n=1 Tax=Arthrobacter sp. I3 TaxID=218158 RepID=UPI0004B9F7C7|nr:choice-of-anchor Q domain-containing protein [Arthrobacter sp. I3]
MNAPADLHLTGTSPAIDRAGTSLSAVDLAGSPVSQDGDCNGTAAADSGAYEFDSPSC